MTKLNWISVVYVIASLIAIGFLTNLSCNNQTVDQTYTLSKSNPAPFTRLTIKGKATEGTTTINGATVILAAPQASKEPLEYHWESKDKRFKFHDEDIYTPDNETLEYHIEVAESGEVVPNTNTPINSTVTITKPKQLGLDVSIIYFVPDTYDISARYKAFSYNKLSLFGTIGYNSRTQLNVGAGIRYEW